MSPEGPRFPSESKSYENDDDKKNKRSKKSANVRVPGIVSLEKPFENTKDKPAELNPIEKALAELAAKRTEKTDDSKDKSSEKTQKEVKSPDESPEVASDSPKGTAENDSEPNETEEPTKDEESSPEEYEPLPIYEPAPVEFSGGEVVVHLNGEEPVAERIIPLQAETVRAEEEDVEEAPAPIFAPQTLQQQQARHEQAPAAPITAEIAPPADVLNRPPTQEEAPIPQPTTTYPAEVIRQRDLAPFAPSSEKPVNKQDIEDALYYAEKSGQNRGVLTGLLVGGAYEHFKHKRREKKAEKRFKQQSKQLKEVRQDFALREQAQTKQTNERERQYNALEKRLQSTVAAEKLSKRNTEALPQSQESEQLRVPEDHRIETSAWHSIEVDAKTGKAVENPAFQYGHEYYRERAQEAAPAAQRNAAAGEVALVAASAGQGGQQRSPLPTPPSAPPDIPLATTQGPPSGAPNDTATKSSSTPAKASATTGPIWPWIVALVVIVVLLAILIH